MACLSDSESEYEDDIKPAKVACLYSFTDLEKRANELNVKYTKETNRFLLYQTMKKLGPALSQKLCQKCE